MTTETLHPLAAGYLERLRRSAGDLPGDRRAELVADVDAHVREAIPHGASDAEALTVLERLGEPEEIVAAERPPAAGSRPRDVATIVLLLLGGFLFGVGWLIGLVLLWSSRTWTSAQRWLGTLLVPGGLATGFMLSFGVGSSETCTSTNGGPEVCTGGAGALAQIAWGVLTAICLLGPIVTAIVLARAARRQQPSGRSTVDVTVD